MLVCRLQALSFPLPNPHKAEGRLIWYNFPLEIANPPVLLPDQKLASYLPNIWHASNLHLRLHTKTLAKTPIYYGIFTHIHTHAHTPKPPNSPFFDGPFPHDQIPIPYSGIWETPPLGTKHLRVIQFQPENTQSPHLACLPATPLLFLILLIPLLFALPNPSTFWKLSRMIPLHTEISYLTMFCL